MKLSDFKKLPRGTYTFHNAWDSIQPVKTSVGKLKLRFFMLNDKEPPDDEMLRLAGELAGYARTHSEYIRAVIWGHYRYCVTEWGPDCLSSDMPADLEPEQIWKYCDPTLVVERNPTDGLPGPPYDCRITVNPQWEPEHNLSLEYAGGSIVTVDQTPFKLAKGILKYVV